METLIFFASPKKEGFTKKILDVFLDNKKDYKIYFPYDMNIKPCRDCGYCKRNSSCSLKDDLGEVFKELRNCKNIIIASPVYFGGFPSPMKSVIDRCQSFYFNPINKEKNLFLLASCGRKREDMEEAMDLETLYFSKAVNGKILGKYVLRDTDKGYYLNEAEINKLINMI